MFLVVFLFISNNRDNPTESEKFEADICTAPSGFREEMGRGTEVLSRPGRLSCEESGATMQLKQVASLTVYLRLAYRLTTICRNYAA